MRNSTVLIVILVGVSALLNYANGEAKEMTCKEFVGGLTQKQLGGIQSCSKSLGLKTSKDKKEKMNCVLKCIMIKEGILGPDGLFTDTGLDAFIEKEIPPSLLEKGGGMFRNCKATTGGVIDPKEDNCKSYGSLIQCLLGVIGELCKP